MAIEGVIGVGKTTLAGLLAPLLDSELLFEGYEDNPFLKEFYTNQRSFAFQTDLFFMVGRFKQLIELAPKYLKRRNLISDYSFQKNKIFAQLTLVGAELELYQQIFDILAIQIHPIDLIIYLRGTAELALERIGMRGRHYEQKLGQDVIESLVEAYDAYFIRGQLTNVLKLNANEFDFIHRESDLEVVVSQIRNRLPGL